MRELVTKFFKSSTTHYIAAIVFAALLGGLISIYGSRAQTAEAADCDSNAIIYCGVSQGNLSSKYNSLDYKGKAAFSDAHVTNPGSCNTVMGSVTRDNKVMYNGQQVANNAYTFGRSYMPGSSQINGGAWKRQPSVSFRSASIPAIICMDHGIFKWAVLTTCGNPVTANPTPKPPMIHISKTRVSHTGAYKVGEEVKYHVTIKNTGSVKAIFPTITDVIPPDAQYVSHYDAGAPQSGYWNGSTFVNPKGGIKHEAKDPNQRHVKVVFGSLNPGQSKTISIRVKITRDFDSDDKICNIANIRAVYYPTKPSNRVCDKIVEPSAVCKKLEAIPAKGIAPLTVKLRATAEVKNGATITGYRFYPGDGSGVKNSATREISHTYTTPGEYTAAVIVDTSVGARTGDQCQVKIKVKKVHEPTFECKSLSANPKDGYAPLKVDFTATPDNPDNLTITDYTYNFGDGNTTSVNDATVSHTYTTPGEYTATVVITATGPNGQVFKTDPNDCKVAIKVKKKDMPKFSCDQLNIATVDADEKLPFVVNFDADASASGGAVIQQYLWNFGDGQTAQTATDTTSHSYTSEGTFTATVRVQTNLGTTPVSEACSKTIVVKEKKPRFECKDLTVKPQSGEAPLAVVFTATGEVDGAVIESYTFSFGDGTQSVTTPQNTVNHTYQTAGDYIATVSIKTDKGTTNPNDCKVSITATKKPVCPYNPQLPPNHPDCKKPEEPCPYNPDLPKDSPDCVVEEEELPAVLPKTGTGVAAIGGGTLMFGAAGAYLRSRRDLIGNILRK